MLTALQVLGALLLLFVASDAFTNAVEWIGALYGLGRSALGAVVAAVGSSLPETMVAAIALLVLRDPASQAVGIGAVLGAPFMLATMVLGLLGIVAYVRGTRKQAGALDASPGHAAFGLSLFMLTFALVVLASFAAAPARVVAAILVVALYAAYLRRQFGPAEAERSEPPPLRLSPSTTKPQIGLVLVQLGVSLAVTILASRWFIASVTAASERTGVPALIVSLLLSPIATELPEAMNVLIWMRRGLDELALGNVVGAMMFQTSIASAIAMTASPWRLDRTAYAACLATFVAVGMVLVVTLARKRVEIVALALCALIYLAYLALVLPAGGSL